MVSDVKPKVSVIIPNYNHARFLQQRIDSVLSQTYQNFEVILMDDCSKDESKIIIEEYRYSNKISKIVYNEKNSGSAFKQWKKGIDSADGDWIWIAESDDYCEANLLETLVNNCLKKANIVLSYSQSYYVEEGVDQIQDMSFHTDPLSLTHWKKDYCNSGLNEINRFLLYRNTIPNASAVLFKKSAYIQADKYFESMTMCGDWMLWIQILKIGDVAFSASPLNKFRAHSSTTRVMDTIVKSRNRLEEEYMIALNIKKTVNSDDIESVNYRISNIILEYESLLSKNSGFKYLFFPHMYKGKIPYYELLSRKFKRLIKRFTLRTSV